MGYTHRQRVSRSIDQPTGGHQPPTEVQATNQPTDRLTDGRMDGLTDVP